jgi:hypothetical protein
MRPRSPIIFLFAVLLIGSATAQSFHSLEADQDRVFVQSNITLTCNENCPANSFRFQYRMPEGSEIVSIEDSLGEINDYSLNSNIAEIVTNRGERRESEVVVINYRIERPAELVKLGLYSRQISLSGFEDEKTSGVVEAEGLISGRTNHGFETSFSEDMRFRGTGPVQINFNFGNGSKTSYYEFFDGEVGESDDSYRIALGVVGLQQSYQRIPVAMYDEDYDDLGFEWSAGLYKAGLIQMRDNEDREQIVLTHETVHALSDRPLNWDRTQTSYIEEGVAKHAESLIQKKLYREAETDSRPANIFGEDKTYRDGGYRYTVSSKGDREELWNYYQEEKDFMKQWSPDHQRREFGYAYSELVVKNFIMQNGSVRDLYTDVESSPTESREEKWARFSELIELEPCNYDERERFDQCLDEVNSHEFEVKAATPVQSNSTIRIDRIEIPERRVQEPSLQGFLGFLNRIIERITEALG